MSDYSPFELHSVVGDTIVGRIIAGNQLTIANSQNNFILDSNGAVLNNASFTLTTTNLKNRIILNAQDGIKIQKYNGSSWENQFYVDSSGNVNFTGNLTGATGVFTGSIYAASGRIGGWNITDEGLSDDYGNYINSNGDLRIGKLYINGDTAIFSGNIYADNLVGQLRTFQIGDGAVTDAKVGYISANKITTGSLSADLIYGGTIRWPGASMGSTATGVSQILADNTLVLAVRPGGTSTITNSEITLKEKSIRVFNKTLINIGGTPSTPANIRFAGNLYIKGKPGLTGSWYVGSSAENAITFTFTNGLLTGVARPFDV